MIVNLKSDTVTVPSEGMLKAMMTAKVGDDVMKEDPTVIELEKKLADMFGMEAALFFPSGTMANQAAIRLHTRLGDQMICDKWAHVYNYEGGSAATLSGVTSCLIDGNRGMFTAEQVREKLNDPEDPHLPLSRLVALENTTNKGGGACWNIDEIKRIRQLCDDEGLALHLDGARLFNAFVASGQTPEEYGKLFDTISICLSKGLGTPIGSVLLGSEDDIWNARRIRKAYGGGMRQVGYLAAAGIYALDNNVERLADDHRRAKVLAESLIKNPKVDRVEPVETNIVIFYVKPNIDEADFVKALADEDIHISNMGAGKLRMVTHLDITDDMISKVCSVLNA